MRVREGRDLKEKNQSTDSTHKTLVLKSKLYFIVQDIFCHRGILFLSLIKKCLGQDQIVPSNCKEELL